MAKKAGQKQWPFEMPQCWSEVDAAGGTGRAVPRALQALVELIVILMACLPVSLLIAVVRTRVAHIATRLRVHISILFARGLTFVGYFLAPSAFHVRHGLSPPPRTVPN